MRSFLRFALLALMLLVVALVSALTAMRFAIHTSEVVVPNLVGKTPVEGRKIAEDSGLQMEVERRYYSSTTPEGKILSQLPPANTQVRRGWQVRVALSLGPQRVEIPSLLGQSQRAAEINIRRRGLDVGALAQLQIAGTPPDQVLSQSPLPNASGVSAPKISLLLTSASQPQALVMANFVGQPLASAVQVLQGVGLRVGVVTFAGQPGSPFSPPLITTPQASANSTIVSHNPAAGEKVIAGSAVNFQVK
ncbi:MAG: penicillin-binding protein [Acidobacteria bacterium]|jgi:beta-lactam-binding protein with PASTA domain|nr:MAG: penicillin-binding protein [Acidobacteriota bacterium]